MKIKHTRLFAPLVLITLFITVLTGGEKAMADTTIYRASLKRNKNHIVVVKKRGENLVISLEGFANKPIELKADSGGTSGCRTIIEHNSAEITVSLSLGIPDPRSRCSMTQSFITIESPKISISEETIKKTSGSDVNIRNSVKKSLGVIDEEG